MTRLALTVPKPWPRRTAYLLILSACVSLGYALLIPYLPEHIPGWARLHVALASGACVLLMAGLLVILTALGYRGLLWAWGGIAAACGLLFVAAGMVTTALEVFFTLSAAALVRAVWLKRHKEVRS